MRLQIFTLLFSLLLTTSLKSQLTTTQTLTPQQLVQNVLLGAGVTASNITFTGNTNQIAKFLATTSTSLGIPSGVYLSTGHASTSSPNGPQGPNNSPSTGTDWLGAGDVLLDGISGVQTFDAGILEFDFIPTGDSIKFKYCFGSEEYPEFVNAGVNDAFAFFLSGPNPGGGTYTNKNIALLPGTNTAVSIDNVNANLNASYYRSNTGNVIDCEFDGFTKVLYALEKVVCGQTYHIKIAIADGGDGIYDSGVFLEGGSFSSAPPLNVYTINSNSNIPDSILVEDCNTYCAYFIRNGNISAIDSFNLQVAGNALLGPDYVQSGNPSFTWPTKLIFAANQDTIKICNIIALQDNMTEGVDTIKFTMSSFTTSSLSCLSSNSINFNLYIHDYTSITIGQSDVTLCSGSSALLDANAGAGYPTYSYTIAPPAVNTATLNTGPINNITTYTITVNDICNKPVTKQITVTPVATPTVVATSSVICPGILTTLTASGATTYSWSNGFTTNTISVTPSVTTTYSVVGSVGSCSNSAISTVSVISQPISITGNNNICLGQTSTLNASGASSYTWNTGATSSVITVTPTSNTTYTATAVIGTCTNTAIHTVSVAPIPTVSISGSDICPGQTGILTATGAASYVWSTGATGTSISVNPISTTIYSVVGSSAASCTNTATFTLNVITEKPEILDLNSVVFCLDSIKNITIHVSNGNPPYSINWLIPNNGIVPFDTINTSYYFTQSNTPSSASYVVIVTDQCLYHDTVTVEISTVDCDVLVPNVVTPNGDGVNDYFKIRGLENFSGSSLTVFNRWGNKIYANDDYKNDWKPNVVDGTYFYIINVSDGRKFNGYFQVFKD